MTAHCLPDCEKAQEPLLYLLHFKKYVDSNKNPLQDYAKYQSYGTSLYTEKHLTRTATPSAHTVQSMNSLHFLPQCAIIIVFICREHIGN